MTHKMLVLLAIVLIYPFVASDVSWAEVKEVEEKTKTAIQRKLEVQKMADEWINEKEAIINEMRQIHNETQWYAFQRKKFEKYVANQRQKIKQMKEERQDLQTMQLQLEPYLEEKISQLDTFIDKDLPFQTESRKSYIQYLKESLYDPDLKLTEKLQRVIKAYQREAKYGKTIGAEVQDLDIKGNTFKANVLRIGRVKLFYMSLDGTRLGAWNKENSDWESVDNKYKRAIETTIDIANQQKTVELVTLPVGGLKE